MNIIILNTIIELLIIGITIQEIQYINEINNIGWTNYTEYIDDNTYDDTDWYLSE